MSSVRGFWKIAGCILFAGSRAAIAAQTAPPGTSPEARITALNGASDAKSDPEKLFEAGQTALNQGHLDEAEIEFRRVLAINPRVGGAYANLGVVYMRRKQWTKARTELHKAERLMPAVPGIRLNIGLSYYRQNDFLRAIPPLESVIREQPDALQPKYLLGLCYFFTENWAEAADTLAPIWAQESGRLSYLYVLSIAAHRSGRKELDDKATEQLIKSGENSPEFHLFMGKAHLNLEQYDLALADFRAAAEANPKLTFVHFNLGLAYLKKQNYEKARDEFLKDIAIEPEVAFNYEKLGEVYTLMQQDEEAEKSYREALRLDPQLLDSYVGLAKTYQREGKFGPALNAIDSAAKLAPQRTDIHYVRGQLLMHMGRKEEGRKEVETSVRLDNEHRAQRQKQVESGIVPSPELLQDGP